MVERLGYWEDEIPSSLGACKGNFDLLRDKLRRRWSERRELSKPPDDHFLRCLESSAKDGASTIRGPPLAANVIWQVRV